MQFKHPEVLYFLFLLIIPIWVHLFQLQKFKKTVFTNVAFLQKITIQTRKSSQLKKWLILVTRLLLLSAIIFAFSQPYFSTFKAKEKQSNFIYLDNSLSTNTKGKKGNLLKVATQEIIENSPKDVEFNLLTNTNFYKNISSSELKKIVINLENTPKSMAIDEVILKINTEFNKSTNTLDKAILISDFQYYKNNKIKLFTNVKHPYSLVQLKPEVKDNLSIDSLYISDANLNHFTLHVKIKNQGEEKKDISIACNEQKKLISKRSFSIGKDTEKIITFKIQKKEVFTGEIIIDLNDTFDFDNSLFFAVNFSKKINILSIGKPTPFLPKIYTDKKFNFIENLPNKINYNAIAKQQLIIINELEKIPLALANTLYTFTKNGGHLIMIPNKTIDIESYNSFLNKLNIGQIHTKVTDSLKITNINYEQPIFKDVFLKKVQNFQYPISSTSYSSNIKGNSIINFENQEAFIKETTFFTGKIYWFACALAIENSNFINSPLIVPVFYTIGQKSLQNNQLYYTVNQKNTIEVTAKLAKDEIVEIANQQNSFIPLQNAQQNKITITTKEHPLKAGFYTILSKKDTLKRVAFNNPKEESSLNFLTVKEIAKQEKNITFYNNVEDVFKEIKKKSKVHWLWKWFLAIAIVSLLLEILIIKFFKI